MLGFSQLSKPIKWQDLLVYKTVRNKTTSYVEIRNHVSFKNTFKIKSKKREKHESSMFSSLGVKDVRPRDVVGSSFPHIRPR